MLTVFRVSLSPIISSSYTLTFTTGNEAEYVILSIVRTTGPGFLVSQNRSNVMLTRCKAGLVIVTNRIFLRTTGAQYTLLGNLARHWTQRHGDSKTWRDWKEIAEHKADMPGAPIPRRSNTSTINTTTSLAAPRPPPPSRVVPAAVNLAFPSASGTLKTNPIAPIINAFPDLGASGVPKNTIKGRWSNSAGVNAIKRVGAGIPVGRAETQVQPPQAKQQPVPPTRSQDHFPMLENVRVEKAKSRRKNSSAAK
jgi:AAA domain